MKNEQGNEICPKCNGEKEIKVVDFAQAKSTKTKCSDCGGTGIKDGKIVNGIVVFWPVTEILIIQKLVEGVSISTLELWLFAARKNGSQMALVGKGERRLPVFFAQIHKMHTRIKYRKKGNMEDIIGTVVNSDNPFLETLNGHRFVGWFETSWHDSTEAGKAILVKHGFKREGERLIFRREGVPSDYYDNVSKPQGDND